MKYDIDDKARLVLKHIVYIAERTAKQIQFCFTKGKKQYYISPKRDIFLTFNLQSPIDFDYPIPDLNHFLSSNIKTIDSQKLITDKDNLFLPTDDDIKEFESGKLIDIVDFPLKDVQLLNSSKTNKFEFINFISIDKKLHYLFQNHIWDWWRDEDNKLIVKRGETTHKFRFIVNRKLITKLLPNDYKLMFKRGVIHFQYKHLNYYFKPENEFHKQAVKNFYTLSDKVTDKHLLQRYKKLNLI